MAVVDKLVIFILCFIVGALAEFCTEYDSGMWSSQRTFYCSTGCCGSYYNRHCCWGSAGTIAGIVIGCLAGVGGIITVIVIICCCCRKGRGAQGQVMTPVGGTTITTATVGQPAYPVTSPAYPGAYPYGQPTQTAGFTQAYPQQPAPFEGPKPPAYTPN